MASVNRFIGAGTVVGMHGLLHNEMKSWGEKIPKNIMEHAELENTAIFVLRMSDARTIADQIKHFHEDVWVFVPTVAAPGILESWGENDIVAVEGVLATLKTSIPYDKFAYYTIIRANKKLDHVHSAAK